MLVWTPSCHSGFNRRSSYRQSRPQSAFPFSYGFADSSTYEAEAAVERATYEYAMAQARVEAARQQRAREEAIHRQRLEQQLRRQNEEALRRQWAQELAFQQQRERQARRRRVHSESLHLFEYPVERAPLDFEFGYIDPAQIRVQELRRQREAELALQQQRQREAQAVRARQMAQLRRQEAQRAIASILAFVPSTEHRAPAHSPVNINDNAAPAASVNVPTTSVPKKDKGKARETPAIPLPTSKPKEAPSTATPSPVSVKDLLEQRLNSEGEDAEVQETVAKLLHDLFGLNPTPKTPAAQSSKTVHFEERGRQQYQENLRQRRSDESLKSAADTASVLSRDNAKSVASRESTVSSESSSTLDEADRIRSLDTIQRVEDSLHTLRASFVFPDTLDFTPSPTSSPALSTAPLPTPDEPATSDAQDQELAFTPRNKPVRAYEHALNGLLTQLDAVASGGDAEIRGRRKEVIKQVERALVEMEKRVREASRERHEQAAVPEEPVAEAVASPEPELLVVESSAADEEPKSAVDSQEQPSEQSTTVDAEIAVPDAEPSIPHSVPSVDPVPSPTEPTETLVPRPEIDQHDADTNHLSSLSAVPSSAAAEVEETSADSTSPQPETASVEHQVADSPAAAEPSVEAELAAAVEEEASVVIEDVSALVKEIATASTTVADTQSTEVSGDTTQDPSPAVEEAPEEVPPVAEQTSDAVEEAFTLTDTAVSDAAVSETPDALPSVIITASDLPTEDVASPAVPAEDNADPISHSESESADAFLLQSPAVSTSASEVRSAASEDDDLEIIQAHEAEASKRSDGFDTDSWSDVESD